MAITMKKPIAAAPAADTVDAHLTPKVVVGKVVKGHTETEMKSGQVVMSTTAKEEKVETELVDSPIPPHRLAHVRVEGALTSNLGNYESARFSVGITLPVDLDDIDEAYEFGCDWVNERIEKQQAEIDAAKAS